MFTYLLCGDLFGAVIVLLFCFLRVSLSCVVFIVFLSAVLCSSCFSPLCCVLRVSLRCVAFFVFLSAVLLSSCFCPLCCFQIQLILVKDGSGQGGAFAAASALRQLSAGIRCS